MIIKRVREINADNEKSIRALLDLAYEDDFSPQDWQHTFGGQYFIGFLDDMIIAHGSVVSRKMVIDEQAVTVGYVEAIAVLPSLWRNTGSIFNCRNKNPKTGFRNTSPRAK